VLPPLGQTGASIGSHPTKGAEGHCHENCAEFTDCSPFGLSIGCYWRHEAVVATGPGTTKVLENDQPTGRTGEVVIGELKPGDTVRVLDYETQKEFRIYKIKLPNGLEGWITPGDNCKVIDLPADRGVK
jgi:hypothetical protein